MLPYPRRASGTSRPTAEISHRCPVRSFATTMAPPDSPATQCAAAIALDRPRYEAEPLFVQTVYRTILLGLIRSPPLHAPLRHLPERAGSSPLETRRGAPRRAFAELSSSARRRYRGTRVVRMGLVGASGLEG